MFLLYYFLLLTKVIIIKTKKDLSYVRSSHWWYSVRKDVLTNFENFLEKHLYWSLLSIKLLLLCKYFCVLAIVGYFYTNKTDLCFFFVFISRLKVLKKSSHVFSFLFIFLQVLGTFFG